MRVGFLFHKNPLGSPVGIDLIRLRGLALGLARLGVSVEIVAPVDSPGRLENGLPVLPLEVLAERGRYDVLKACYHFSLDLLGDYAGPLVCRLVRVVDESLPRRDEPFRSRLLACQALAAERAQGLVLGNAENAARWREHHGRGLPVCLLPSGCPAELPPPGPSPYPDGLPVLLFLGSLAAPRMSAMLNALASRLEGRMAIHHLGRDKGYLYGDSEALAGVIRRHGERPEPDIWDYVRNAQVGLALGTGEPPFDNDLSKVWTCLRGGLPVLCEDGVLNAPLAVGLGMGSVFRKGNAVDGARQALALIRSVAGTVREQAMRVMAAQHSWDARAAELLKFLKDGRIGVQAATPCLDICARPGNGRG